MAFPCSQSQRRPTNGQRLRAPNPWVAAIPSITPSSSSDFTVSGTPISRNALVVQAGLDLAVTDALTVGLNYDGQLASDAQDNAVQGNVKFQF